MADVFISYSREDRPRADQIARSLQAQGLDVFWDSEIPPGQTWADYIEAKLAASKVMVVLWSAHSIKSQWVREEARIGRDKGKFIPVLVENVSVPLGFGEVQAANLAGWTGDPNHAEWRRFRDAVFAAVGAAPRPQPAAAARQSFNPAPAFASTGAAAGNNLSPIDYVRKCFALYVDGKGRARRAEYWWWFLFVMLIVIVAAVLDVALFGVNPSTQAANAPVFTLLGCLAVMCPSVSVGARRLHDVGLSGWLYPLVIVPYIGWLFMVVVALIPSKNETNRYGPNPKLAPV